MIKPLNKRVLCKLFVEGEDGLKKVGSLFVAETVDSEQEGAYFRKLVVEEVADDCILVKKGDVCIASPYAGKVIKDAELDFVMITETEILGIIK